MFIVNSAHPAPPPPAAGSPGAQMYFPPDAKSSSAIIIGACIVSANSASKAISTSAPSTTVDKNNVVIIIDDHNRKDVNGYIPPDNIDRKVDRDNLVDVAIVMEIAGVTDAQIHGALAPASTQMAVPLETALHPNYPNPFNPETWIPYQLSTPAEVSVSIYAVDGRLVRHLALGHQPAGAYISQSRVAYWDGRNAQGEPVASGIYFYTLTAGDFTATRKMYIRK